MMSGRAVRVLGFFTVLQLSLVGSAPLGVQALESEQSAQCIAQIPPPAHINSLIQSSIDEPLPTGGRFPSPSSSSDVKGASYEVLSGPNHIAGLRLDGIQWVVTGQASFSDIATAEAVPFQELADISEVLRMWSQCSEQAIPEQLMSFMSDFGTRWVATPGDPFFVQQSPVSAVYFNSTSRARGSLPLLLMEARKLSDGRVALLIGEGSAISDEGLILGNFIPSSIWVMDQTQTGWKIDAVFGAFAVYGASYIEI